MSGVRQELNINYISVVTIVNYLTPHFLKLAVRTLMSLRSVSDP